MATVYWDSKGILLTKFMEPGTTINAAFYCETLHKLRRAIQNKRQRILNKSVMLVHDNCCAHNIFCQGVQL